MLEPSNGSESRTTGLGIQHPNHKGIALEAANLAYVYKTNESIISQELGICYVLRNAKSVLHEAKSVVPPLFNCPNVLSSVSDKAKFYVERTLLGDSGISLPVFPSRTNQKLNSIPVNPKNLITDLDF